MTQPAASKQLKGLEDVLEVKLFERLPRGLEPTLFGETMIRHARTALTSLSLAHEDIVALKNGPVGQVDVGVTHDPGDGLAAACNFSRQARCAAVAHRRADGDQQGEELTVEPACAVARVGHPMVGATDLQRRDLAAQAWILPPPGSALRHRWELMFRRAALEPPTNAVDTTALLLITALLQQNDSLHVMPIEATLDHDVKTYNHRISQRALNHLSPVQALKKWQAGEPELFVKRVYNQAGLDMAQKAKFCPKPSSSTAWHFEKQRPRRFATSIDCYCDKTFVTIGETQIVRVRDWLISCPSRLDLKPWKRAWESVAMRRTTLARHGPLSPVSF